MLTLMAVSSQFHPLLGTSTCRPRGRAQYIPAVLSPGKPWCCKVRRVLALSRTLKCLSYQPGASCPDVERRAGPTTRLTSLPALLTPGLLSIPGTCHTDASSGPSSADWSPFLHPLRSLLRAPTPSTTASPGSCSPPSLPWWSRKENSLPQAGLNTQRMQDKCVNG